MRVNTSELASRTAIETVTFGISSKGRGKTTAWVADVVLGFLEVSSLSATVPVCTWEIKEGRVMFLVVGEFVG